MLKIFTELFCRKIKKPRIGDVVAENLTAGDTIDLVKRCIEYYSKNGKKKERTSKFMDRVGINSLKEAIL